MRSVTRRRRSEWAASRARWRRTPVRAPPRDGAAGAAARVGSGSELPAVLGPAGPATWCPSAVRCAGRGAPSACAVPSATPPSATIPSASTPTAPPSRHRAALSSAANSSKCGTRDAKCSGSASTRTKHQLRPPPLAFRAGT
eukprot:scaffold820_cov104-Isochrysis_galbana.AAC.4